MKMLSRLQILLILTASLSHASKDTSDCPCELMEQPDLWKKELTARWMVHSLEYGVLTTISSRLPNHPPSGNVYSFVDGSCDNPTGTPYFYGTYMDLSFIDMKHNNMASFTLTEASLGTTCAGKTLKACDTSQMGDPENPVCARLTLTGQLVQVDMNTEEYQNAKEAFFQRHPQMQLWPADHNWVIAKLVLEDIWLIDYFGGASVLSVEDYYAAELETPATDFSD